MEEKLDRILELLSTMQSQNTFRLWSLDEELLLRDLYLQGVSDLDIAVALRQEFKSERSSSAVRKRAQDIGLTRIVKLQAIEGIYDDPPF